MKKLKPTSNIWKPRIELDDLEPVVHTRHKQVVLSVLRRMPFYTPNATPDMSLLERSKGHACVKETNFFVVTKAESTRDLYSN